MKNRIASTLWVIGIIIIIVGGLYFINMLVDVLEGSSTMLFPLIILAGSIGIGMLFIGISEIINLLHSIKIQAAIKDSNDENIIDSKNTNIDGASYSKWKL